MTRYLIDANLPYYFSLWSSSDFIHVLISKSWNEIESLLTEYSLINVYQDWIECIK